MFFNNTEQSLEQEALKQEKLLQELLIRMDALDREAKVLYQELDITPEQLRVFLENRENFTEENWETLQEQRKALDEKLKCVLDNVSDPIKAKKAQESRRVAPHWLFVR